MYAKSKWMKHICPVFEEYFCNSDTNIKSFTYHFYGNRKNIYETFYKLINKNNII
jgi:hypothetical protein